MTKSTKIALISISIVIVLISGAVLGFFVYVGDYYRADEDAIKALNSNDLVEVKTNEDRGYIAFIPKVSYNSALVFIPGGKVEYTAYAPLMQEYAKRGVLCVLLKVKFNLATFDLNAPKGIQQEFKGVDNWAIGGHSLGGSVAAVYVSNNPDEYKSLILLGSYSSKDLSNFDINCVVIYGSEDKVLNMGKYEKSKSNLPKNTTIQIINGGNHAQFGSYGEQKGDGKAEISKYLQWEYTAVYSCPSMF